MNFSTRDLSIISNRNIDAIELSEVYRSISSVRIVGDRVLIDTADGYVAIDPNPYAESEYDSDVLEMICKRIHHPNFYILRYTATKAAEEVIKHWPTRDEALIDNNLGRIVSMPVAIDAIRADVNWIDLGI